MAQVVEHLPLKPESFKPQYHQKKKKKEEEDETVGGM
jgi:hypothetical protein